MSLRYKVESALVEGALFLCAAVIIFIRWIKDRKNEENPSNG